VEVGRINYLLYLEGKVENAQKYTTFPNDTVTTLLKAYIYKGCNIKSFFALSRQATLCI